MSQSAAQRAHAEELVRKIVNALDDKKATDIRVIDITGKSSVADYLVVATGSADQHLRGMRIEVEKTLDEASVKIDGVESQPESGWTVMGTFEVMIHLFRADQRANFRIEQLWKDGVEIPVAKFIKPVAKPTGFVDVSGNTKSAAVKKAPAKKPVPVKAPMVKKALVSKLAATKAAVQAAAQANGKKAQRLAKKAAKAAPVAKPAKAVAPAKAAPKSAAKGKPVASKAPVKKAAVVTKKTAAKPVAKVAAKAPAKAIAKPVAKKPVKAAKPAAKAGVVTRKARKA